MIPTRAPDPGPGRVARFCLIAFVLAAASAAGPFAGGAPASAAPFAPVAPAAQERSWTVESFEAEITVLENRDVVVTETIRPRFQGTFNGIVRLIPVEYRTPGGRFAHDLRLSVEEVTDGEGRELRYELGRERHYRTVKIWIPGAADATRTVRIRYAARRALRFHDGYDELYWNVTGDEWPVPIESSRAVVHLPGAVTGVRATAFTGPYGSVERDADIAVDANRIEVRAGGELGMWEGLTVGVAWDPGVVRRPTAADRVRWFLLANGILLLPPIAFGFMFVHWRRRGRDPHVGSVATRYEPPDGLTPGEVGVVIDDRPDMRDITATLVDLAVRGHLRIEEREEKKLLGLRADRDHRFRRRTDPEEWEALLPHERALLESIFNGGARRSVTLSGLENVFYRHLPRIREKLLDTLLHHGVYERRPDRVKARYLGIGAVVGGLLLGALAVAGEVGLAPASLIVAAVLTTGVIAGFGRLMPVRTKSGARMLRDVRGFEEFLRQVESDRFRRMITGPELFEKYLPYAMALGVDKQWAAAFEGMYRQPPEWYRGADVSGFRTGAFVADLGRMSSRTASAMSSRPRSAGGSAFGGGGGGGGGFSGGGFGGGGGRAF